MSISPPKLDERVQWNSLFHSLEHEKCILCIGPDILNPPNGERLEDQLAQCLRANAKSLKISVYDDGWFHYQPGAPQLPPYLKVKEFYEQPHPWAEELMGLIARMPFHFILYLSPDYKMKEAFELQGAVQGTDFVFDSYKRGQPANKSIKVPTKDKPLVFNFLGELKIKDSLVMTYADYYEYVRSIFMNNSLSDDLKTNVFDAEYFVFLGMPFDKWYVHLFMHMLQQHVSERKQKFSANTFLNNQTATHCNEQYTMTFVPDEIGIEAFVRAMYEHCEDRNMLRSNTPGASRPRTALPYAQLRQWVIANEFQDIFDLLAQRLKATEWLDECVDLESQYEDLRKKTRRGTLSSEQQTVETNRVREAVQDFIKTLQRNFPDEGGNEEQPAAASGAR